MELLDRISLPLVDGGQASIMAHRLKHADYLSTDQGTLITIKGTKYHTSLSYSEVEQLIENLP